MSYKLVCCQWCTPKAAWRNLLLQWFLFFLLVAFNVMGPSFELVVWFTSACHNNISIAFNFREPNCFISFLSVGTWVPWFLFSLLPFLCDNAAVWASVRKLKYSASTQVEWPRIRFSDILAQPELCLRLHKWCWDILRKKWPLWNVFFIKTFKEAF